MVKIFGVEMMAKKRYPKYKKNLFTEGDNIFSYNTLVAVFDRAKGAIIPEGWWSVTTSKHINYIGEMWGIKVKKNR